MLRLLFDSRNNSLWLLAAFMLLIIGMLAALFIPMVSSLFRFQSDSKIGFTPLESSFWLFTLGFVSLAATLYLVYRLPAKRLRIRAALIGSILGICICVVAFQQYIYIDEHYIEVGQVLQPAQYTWDDFLFATHTVTADGMEFFTIETTDGEVFDVIFGGLLGSDVQRFLQAQLKAQNIVIERMMP